MKKTSLVIAISLLQISTSFADTYDYACKVTPALESGKTIGKAYNVHVDDVKKVLTFQGKRYEIIEGLTDCGKAGWNLKGDLSKFCASTHGGLHSRFVEQHVLIVDDEASVFGDIGVVQQFGAGLIRPREKTLDLQCELHRTSHRRVVLDDQDLSVGQWKKPRWRTLSIKPTRPGTEPDRLDPSQRRRAKAEGSRPDRQGWNRGWPCGFATPPQIIGWIGPTT
jgi:hypothetical protein